MKGHIYKVINADNVQIDRIALPLKNVGTASMKLKHKYGDKACFLKLEYQGFEDLKLAGEA